MLAPAQTQAAPPNLEQAANLFAITCSSSFCHGDGGVGARGPSLRNRDFTADFVRTTMLQGRSGTPMPAFKDSLAPDEVAMIVAYVMSLSPNNHGAGNGAATAEAAPPAQASIPISEQAERGKALFFDLTRPAACALCHSYQDRGGPVGPDLASLAQQPARALYQRIVQPADGNAGYPALVVTTRDGKSISGIQADRTDTTLRLYDLSSAPPVLRSFYTADGIKIAPAGKSVYVHDLAGYSKTDLADLIAYLQSAAGEGKKVVPQDFAAQEEPR
jgi:putative heme-binding domain-containing protein